MVIHRYSEFLKFYLISFKFDLILGSFFCSDLYMTGNEFTENSYKLRCEQNLDFK